MSRYQALTLATSLCLGSLPALASPDSSSATRKTNTVVQYSGSQVQTVPSTIMQPGVVPSNSGSNVIQMPAISQTLPQTRIIEGSQSNFQQEVIQSQSPVLVEFYATWCPHCQKMDSVLQSFTHEFRAPGKVVRIDIDKNPQLVSKYKVGPVPAFFVMKNGNVIDSIVGETNVSRLTAGMSKSVI